MIALYLWGCPFLLCESEYVSLISRLTWCNKEGFCLSQGRENAGDTSADTHSKPRKRPAYIWIKVREGRREEERKQHENMDGGEKKKKIGETRREARIGSPVFCHGQSLTGKSAGCEHLALHLYVFAENKTQIFTCRISLVSQILNF